MAKQPGYQARSTQGGTSELKRRLLFVLGALIVFRIGSFIPVPGIDAAVLAQLIEQQKGTIIDMFNMFSGGALSRASIFALGIMPYISASIIIQLLATVHPALAELRKEGESGRRKISKYTRYSTVLLATLQAVGISTGLPNMLPDLVPNLGFGFYFTAVVSLVTGTMFLMWLGEQITEHRQAQAEHGEHRVRPVHGRPQGGGVAVVQRRDRHARERAEGADERADGPGVLLVAPAQRADGLAGAAGDARVGDDQVGALDALAEGAHLAALEPDGAGGAGRGRVQPGRPAVRDLLGRLREREQLAGGGVAPAGVQDGADDRARGGGRRSQPALVGEVAAGGDLEGQVQASGELPGRLEGPGDAGEPGPGVVDGAAVVETAQPRGAVDGGGRRPHLQIVQRQGHGGVPVHDGVLAQDDGLGPGAAMPHAGGGAPFHVFPCLWPASAGGPGPG